MNKTIIATIALLLLIGAASAATVNGTQYKVKILGTLESGSTEQPIMNNSNYEMKIATATQPVGWSFNAEGTLAACLGPLAMIVPQMEGISCNDGVQNNGEEGIDCGGPCDACPANVTSYLVFIKPDGTPGCLLSTTTSFNQTVRLIVGNERTCDLEHVTLSVTYPNTTTASMLASSCANGDHLFVISSNQTGNYQMSAYSTATNYTLASAAVNCNTAFAPTTSNGLVARLPDSNIWIVLATAMLAFALFFRRRK